MWWMMAIEHPAVSAAITRLPQAKENLAAYEVASSLALTIESPVIRLLIGRLWQGVPIRYGWTKVVGMSMLIRLGTLAVVLIAGVRFGFLPRVGSRNSLPF